MIFGANSGSMLYTIFMVVALFGITYFMVIRPSKKQNERRKQMMDSLEVGSDVITIGGLHGTIQTINNENRTVVLLCEGIRLVFEISAIGRVVEKKKSETKKVLDSSENKED